MVKQKRPIVISAFSVYFVFVSVYSVSVYFVFVYFVRLCTGCTALSYTGYTAFSSSRRRRDLLFEHLGLSRNFKRSLLRRDDGSVAFRITILPYYQYYHITNIAILPILR